MNLNLNFPCLVSFWTKTFKACADAAALKKLVTSALVLCSKCSYFRSGARKVRYIERNTDDNLAWGCGPRWKKNVLKIRNDEKGGQNNDRKKALFGQNAIWHF